MKANRAISWLTVMCLFLTPAIVFAQDAVTEGDLKLDHGQVNWTWLDVSLLWVAESHRGRGLGSKILRAFEDAGRDRGCTSAHLSTFTYQAAKFYRRHGYEEYARLPDYPPGHRQRRPPRRPVAPVRAARP